MAAAPGRELNRQPMLDVRGRAIPRPDWRWRMIPRHPGGSHPRYDSLWSLGRRFSSTPPANPGGWEVEVPMRGTLALAVGPRDWRATLALVDSLRRVAGPSGNVQPIESWQVTIE